MELRGITIGKTTAPGQVRFAGAVPAFMKDSLAATLDNKSILDPKYNRLFNTNISELSGVSQDAIKKLLGNFNISPVLKGPSFEATVL